VAEAGHQLLGGGPGSCDQRAGGVTEIVEPQTLKPSLSGGWDPDRTFASFRGTSGRGDSPLKSEEPLNS